MKWINSIVAGLAIMACIVGCRHRRSRMIPHGPAAHLPRAQIVEPRLTVITNGQNPISYQWAFTNGPNGARVLRFQAPQ